MPVTDWVPVIRYVSSPSLSPFFHFIRYSHKRKHFLAENLWTLYRYKTKNQAQHPKTGRYACIYPLNGIRGSGCNLRHSLFFPAFYPVSSRGLPKQLLLKALLKQQLFPYFYLPFTAVLNNCRPRFLQFCACHLPRMQRTALFCRAKQKPDKHCRKHGCRNRAHTKLPCKKQHPKLVNA